MAMNQGGAKPDATTMNSGAGGGCANMKMNQGAAATADAKPMDHGTGGACCGNDGDGQG